MVINQMATDTAPTKTKGHGENGAPAGHQRPRVMYNPFNEETGRYFLHGLGCDKCDNCFDCILPKCTWQKRTRKIG